MVGRGKVDFRSCLFDESVMAEPLEQAEGGVWYQGCLWALSQTLGTHLIDPRPTPQARRQMSHGTTRTPGASSGGGCCYRISEYPQTV